MVHEDRLFRRTKKGSRQFPDIPTRSIILQGMDDDIGHWDFESTYEFIASRFWWPNIRSEVSNFVRSCDVCQKTKLHNWKEFQRRIPVSGLFSTWSVDFAGPFPKTKDGNQYLLVGIEHTYKYPVARVMPAELFNDLGALTFVKEEIIVPFVSLKFVSSDNDLKFDYKAIEDFSREQKVQWKHTATYNPGGHGIAENMMGTIKRALQKMSRENVSDWGLCFDQAL